MQAAQFMKPFCAKKKEGLCTLLYLKKIAYNVVQPKCLTVINQPGHTKGVELLIKEFHSLRKHSGVRALPGCQSVVCTLLKALLLHMEVVEKDR